MKSFCSEQICELAQALINVQRQLQPATKDANNPFTKSRYATLNSVMDSCRDALLSNNIWLCQYPVPAEPGYLGLVTKLTHAESGQWQSSLAVVPLPKADPQGVGISMTYMRRYALSAMLGIVTEEDTNGEFASDKFNRPQRQKKAANAPQRDKTTQDELGKQKRFHHPQIERQKDFPSCLVWMEFHTKSYRHRMVGSVSSSQETRRRKWNSSRRQGFTGTRNEESGGSSRIAGRAVLDGAALSVFAISTGEMDGRNNQKYGSGRIARNPLLWTGTGCGTANG